MSLDWVDIEKEEKRYKDWALEHSNIKYQGNEEGSTKKTKQEWLVGKEDNHENILSRSQIKTMFHEEESDHLW